MGNRQQRAGCLGKEGKILNGFREANVALNLGMGLAFLPMTALEQTMLAGSGSAVRSFHIFSAISAYLHYLMVGQCRHFR